MKTWQAVVTDVTILLVGAALAVFGVIWGSDALLVLGAGMLTGFTGVRIGQKSEAAKRGNGGPRGGIASGLVVGAPLLFTRDD